MADSCPECGATVPEGGSCRDYFDALMLLESQIPGGPGQANPLGFFVSTPVVAITYDLSRTGPFWRAPRPDSLSILTRHGTWNTMPEVCGDWVASGRHLG